MKRGRKEDSCPGWHSTLSTSVHPSLLFTQGDHGKCGIASSTIPSGSTLMSIPYTSILSETYASNTRRGKYTLSLLGKSRPIECTGRALLYLEMVHQRFGRNASDGSNASDGINGSDVIVDSLSSSSSSSSSSSKECMFRDYLRSLPSEYEDPAWWKEEEVKELLAGTNLMEGAMLRRAWLKRIYTALVPELTTSNPDLFKKDIYTYENFLWAHSAFSSRGFPHILSQKPDEKDTTVTRESKVSSIPTFHSTSSTSQLSAPPPPLIGCEGATGVNPFQDPPHEPIGCMLPVLDLLNHAPRTPIAWIRNSEGVSFIHEGKEALQTGEEVNNNYGPKSNEELLMGFGFTLPTNADDTYTLAIRPIVAPPSPIQDEPRANTKGSSSSSSLSTMTTMIRQEELNAYNEAVATATIFKRLELPTRYVLRMRMSQEQQQQRHQPDEKKKKKKSSISIIDEKEREEGVIPIELYQLARLDSLCRRQKEAIHCESKEYLTEVLSRRISIPVEDRALDFLESLLRNKEQGLLRAQPWLKEEEKDEQKDDKVDGSMSAKSAQLYRQRRYLARSYIRGQHRLLLHSLAEIQLKREEINLDSVAFLLPILQQSEEEVGEGEVPVCLAVVESQEMGRDVKKKSIETIPLVLDKSMKLITCDDCKQEMEEEEEEMEEIEIEGKEEEVEEEEGPKMKRQRRL